MMRKFLPLALALALPLSGCISFGEDPPAKLMSLSSDARVPANTAKTVTDKETISVGLITAPTPLRNQRVAVRSNDAFAYLPKTAWADEPARLFRNVLAETIEAKTGRFVPDSRNISITPATRLGGSLVAFQLLGGQGKVLAIYDATVAREGSDQIRTRRFEATAPVASEDAADVVAALNRASNAIASDVADWVAQ
ncbi:ABC-type transport auxiliary lipoprotein family protein [Sphingomonas crocodyli]|uniref:ABC transporter n=1 Tax=Sphingomonas crocodyli TaxID=1979270 RepID=A0A437M595_9SPHN|nr:ABC-type transport auxiliary lipoprotein family protein [Sphingomonas crocodyli]RVT92715.1 ABC transporter [Sphingomonas crocodyli]